MLVHFAVSTHTGWIQFIMDVPKEDYEAAPKKDRAAYFRKLTGDLRFSGDTVMDCPVRRRNKTLDEVIASLPQDRQERIEKRAEELIAGLEVVLPIGSEPIR